jgi:TrmH family RNA methyltransferase
MTSLPIRFVLVDTSHPGNIGAVARAMKNMGLAELTLVNPREFPHPEAVARASGADDVLAGARVVSTLQEAIAGCGLVLATTARMREQYFRVLEVREAALRLVAEARSSTSPVAVLFGTERFGLSNEHLLAAHALLRIPANPAYESLNMISPRKIYCAARRLDALSAASGSFLKYASISACATCLRISS